MPHLRGFLVRSTQTLRALGLVVALGLTVAACGGHGEAEKKDGAGASSQTVTVATATETALPRVVTASGSVSAWEEVPIGAETGGLVATAVLVDEGSYVRQGQPLVQLNTALLSAAVRQQQAALQTAQANAARDDAALDRAQQLKDRGFLSQASLDTALANQARATLAQSQTQLSQATIRAPVSGLIISRSVTRGQIVAAGTELFRMVRDGRLELDAQVPETDLPLIRAGMTAAITSDQAGETSGSVRIVTSEVDPETRLGIARIALASNSGLKPGMFASARIDVGSQPGVTVPTASVLYRDNRAGVFILQTNNTVRFIPVTVVNRSADRTAVANVQPGARIVVSGAGFLNEGDRVTVQAAQRPAAPAQQTTAPARK
jgi:RND family efflux transporter MFP subunit